MLTSTRTASSNSIGQRILRLRESMHSDMGELRVANEYAAQKCSADACSCEPKGQRRFSQRAVTNWMKAAPIPLDEQ